MRYIRFIAAFAALISVAACVIDPLDTPAVNAPSESCDDVTVVARVARFDDREIDTRGTKNDAEANVTCMAVAIFPIENGAIGDCVFYDFRMGNQLLFTINRQETKNGAYIYNVDKPYVMYVFANLPTMTEETCANMSLDQMKAMAYSVENVKIPANGFPMIGSLGDATDTNDDKKGDTTITPEGDGKTFILKPGSASNPTLPLVNGEESDLLNVPMKGMFSKVNFTIKVTPDQTVDVHLTPQFTLKGYSVNNVPASVDFAMGGKPRLSHSVTDDVTSVIGPFADPMPLLNGINIARGTQTINFTFYLPERYLTPTYQSHDGSKDGQQGYYNYPFPVVSGKYRAEDLDLRQRFKPLLPDGQAATYVTINGTFRDHQQHEFDVTYDVYLGDDNYGNFDTERNCEYFHYINIRGILNSDDQVAYDPDKEMPVSIDHRVDVTRVEPIIINLRRETLLDSHFEVRPLRIRKNLEYKGDLTKAKVKVEVIYDKTPDQKWIGLERSFGNGTQQANGTYLVATDLTADRQNSLGKRKYFTTDLTYTTLAGESQKDANGYSTTGGQSVIFPITDNDYAVWIYVDEALVAEAGDATRKATIRVTYAEDGTNYSTPIDYVIQQRQLFPVTYGGITYLIEYDEEYLHNFDASDSYGQTDFEGIQWGLPNQQLSNRHRAYFATGTFAGIMNWLMDEEEVNAYYDFYLMRDINSTSATRRDNAGFTFTNEIIQTINGYGGINSEAGDNIDVLHLAQDPESAIEYCFNKNKRNADGQVAWQDANGTAHSENLVWYLPAIDEIENIMMGAYSDFLVFQNKPYWSSQPAFFRGRGHYHSALLVNEEADYYFDDTSSARATKILYSAGTYSNMSSGVDGYEQIMDIYKPLWGMENDPVMVPVTSSPFTYEGCTVASKTDKKNHTGNMPRTSYARVRCVRKQ